MKTLFTIISAFLFCVSNQAQLYRLVVNGTDFYAVQSGTSSNLFMATNTIASTRYLTMGTGVLLGRGTAGSGAIEQITLGTGLSLSGTTLNGSSSGTIGTMINSGASTTSQYPKYTDTTGTNLAPDTITLASADFANQGTATTVLHGNAAGNPTWGAVALATDVSGTLAAAQFPALTGDITTTAGALATTLKNTGPGVSTFTSVTIDAQGRVTAGSNPTTQTTLDQVLAAVGNSSIANGAFTTAMSWTNRNAGTYSTTLKYGLGQATAGGLNITEIAKSTGGAAGQNLMTIQTINGSTANPLQILVGGTNALMIYNVNNQLLAGDAAGNPDSTYPEYSYLINNRYGTALNPGGYLEFIINGAARARVDSQGVKATSAGTAGNPAYSFTASTSSGTYSPFTGTVGLSGGGVLGLWVTNSMVLVTNFTLNGTLTASNSTVGTSGQVLTSGGAGNVPSWTTISAGGASLDAITADAASSTIGNGAFTNWFRWTDPGASKISFLISGTNTTASTTFELLGQMTSATALFNKITESTASTGGSGSQYLVSIGTLASSTATPLHVASRANTVFDVGYNATQIWAGTPDNTSSPQYSASVRKTSGVNIVSGSTTLQYDANNYVKALNGSAQINTTGSPALVANLSSSGGVFLSALQTDGATVQYSFGSGGVDGLGNGTPGIAFLNRVLTTTSGSVSINAGISATPTDSGAVLNNNGASGTVTYNLPSATIGYSYTFTVTAAQNVVVTANGTDTIRINGSITSAGGTLTSNTVGNVVTVVCYATGKWIVTSYVGTVAVTWTVA